MLLTLCQQFMGMPVWLLPLVLFLLRSCVGKNLLLPSESTSDDLHAIILVPGYGTNMIEARLTEAYEPALAHCGAQKGKGWFRLWLNYTALQDPSYVQCFAEQMSLVYDPVADDYHNIPGIKTRIPFFGSTQGFRYKDPDHKDQFEYMVTLVEHLEGIGYREGENLFGAPYDFRYSVPAPPGHPSKVGLQYLHDLRELVEEASKLNRDKPVILLTHSFGGLLAHQLLLHNPLSWRQRFIKHFLPLSYGLGGTVTAMDYLISGINFGFSFIDPSALKQEYRSLESSLWPLPTPTVFGDIPLVVTKGGKSYSALGMVEFFKAIGFSNGILPYETLVLPSLQNIPAPLVPVTCIHGAGVSTPERLVYGDGGFNGTPDVIWGDGDGTINLISLLAVQSEWSVPGQDLKMIMVTNASHGDIIKLDFALEQVMTAVQEANSLVSHFSS